MEVKKILYVGNDYDFVAFLEASLGESVSVRAEKNGLVAIESMDNAEAVPEIILAEINIPGISGFQFHRALRNKDNLDHVAFILLNKVNNFNLNARAFDEGIDDVLVKEVDQENLMARLNFLTNFRNNFHNVIEKQETNIYTIPLAKRLFDILVASSALLAISPILILIAILIKLESKGPIYYVSKRVGTGYHIFNFYKLRSMFVDADERLKDLAHLNQYAAQSPELDEEPGSCLACEALGHPCSPILYIDGKEICENHHQKQKKTENTSAFLKIKDDPRITRIGKFIRKTSIDELPQLVNVLKGDMSIVGNRPLPLYEAEQLTSDAWTARFNAPAGITGLWQISKRGKAEMSDEERKGLDNQYAKNNSFTKDLALILKTVPALFQKENV